MLELKNISITRGAKILADSLCLSTQSKKFLSIVGPNGCGKTTLLHAVAKLIKPQSGTVYIDGMDTDALSLPELSKKLGFLPQKTRTPDLKVFDMVLLGRKPIFGFAPKQNDFDKVESILTLLNMEELSSRECGSLSGGEFQKVLLAKALAQEPKVMLLDEPTNHLDAKNRVEMLSLFKAAAKEQEIALVAVLHDINDALRFSDSVALVNNGEILYSGEPKNIEAAHLEELYGIGVRIFENDGFRYAAFGA